jgi:hypothetical protein
MAESWGPQRLRDLCALPSCWLFFLPSFSVVQVLPHSAPAGHRIVVSQHGINQSKSSHSRICVGHRMPLVPQAQSQVYTGNS